jgi:hypothetical protein
MDILHEAVKTHLSGSLSFIYFSWAMNWNKTNVLHKKPESPLSVL